jgi:LysM repeat protein
MKRFTLALLIVSLMALSLPSLASANSTTCAAFHQVQRGDTLSKIARQFNIGLSDLLAWNRLPNANYIQVGQNICVRATTIIDDSPVGQRTHTVQRGETLTRIARQYGVSMAVLAQVNGISNANVIKVGQVLQIPDVTIQ